MSDKAPQEIERKFLVKGNGWRRRATSKTHIEQGYLARGRKTIVRVRIKNGKTATLTIKSRDRGASRAEFEYAISLKDAKLLMALCGGFRIEKWRYEVPSGKQVWEVDVFVLPTKGLVLAEIELDHEDEPVALPRWVGDEVTHDQRYRNSSLVAGLDDPLTAAPDSAHDR